MKNITWLIDNGHGGLVDGKYVTAPNKMYDHGDFVFHEGIWNRKVARVLVDMLASEGIKHRLITPENEDTPIWQRVRRINELHLDKQNPVIALSIHANGGKGKGCEHYTYFGQTESDVVAEFLYQGFELVFPNKVQRTDLSDGDKDKEENFAICRDTNCPTVLTESGFMDRYEEAKYMLTEEGIIEYARAHFEGIKMYMK